MTCDGDRQWYEEMAARVVTHDAEHPGYQRRWAHVCVTMLTGEERAVPPLAPLPAIHLIAQFGRHLDATVTRCDGQPNHCHGNAAQLWVDGNVDTIATGFALNDNIWRTHSWGVRNGQFVETTVPRERYFGVILTGPGSAVFAAQESVLSPETPAGSVLADLIAAFTHLSAVHLDPAADVWPHVGEWAIQS
jgi:hypothetical protein